MSETFLPANILMPQVDSMKKWAVIACDQFSSQPEYWDEVKEYVGNTPSTLHLMLPEAYLGSEEEDEKIRKIQSTMKNYADDHLLKTYENSLVYVERTLQNGKIRRGIVGAIDLEQYIAGWLVDGEVKEQFLEKLRSYEEQMTEKYKDLSDDPMVYAVGDGNHSLATAKACYEKLKKNHRWEHIKDHPARYALVELENLHDDSQQFEPIHRVITGTDPEELIHALKTECCSEEGETIRCYYGKKEEVLHLNLHR